MRSSPSVLRLQLTCLLSLIPTGCSLSPTAAPSPDPGVAIQGAVHGGQQPIVGAHVYLFAANTTGYGGPGIASSNSNASVSLLSGTGNSDSIGAYVLSDSSGDFSITGDYACTPNTQVYAYALGGNPGAGTNSAAGLLAVLGKCPSAGNFQSATPFIFMNEVSTVAAAYAFAGFASDATHVSSSGTALAQVGIQNAFANAANLADLSTGTALATTPAGNGTVPQKQINTLANILSSCVNSTGAIVGPTNPTPCYTLFNDAESGGSTGTLPSDTATAAIDIAHNPGSNLAVLFALQTALPPFPFDLGEAPSDFIIGLEFTGGALSSPHSIAIDSSGNAWVPNYEGNSVTELSSTGAVLSGTNGYTGGALNMPDGIAIDSSGNAWIANYGGASVTEISSSGSILSGTNGYTGGMNLPDGISIDGIGNAWVVSHDPTDGVVKFSSSGVLLSGTAGYTGGGIFYPSAIAMDGSGNAWITDYGTNTITELPSSGFLPSGIHTYTGGGLNVPYAIAIDSSGSAWIANSNGNNVIKLSNTGTVLSGVNGYTGGGLRGPNAIALDGAGNAWLANAFPNGVSELTNSGSSVSPSSGYSGATLPDNGTVAVDGSGDIWHTYNDTVVEFVGAATPVITPIAAGLPVTPTGDGSSSLGTRP
jgi:hypothetical protein